MATTRELEIWAAKLRVNLVELVESASSGHLGGSLSMADFLAVLYGEELRVRPEEPRWDDRDRLVLSKGHCTPALYSALRMRGFIDDEDLSGYRKVEGHLSGHAEMRDVPGVDMSTGSLGQGLSVAVGMAIASRLGGKKNRVFCILGDGELGEGQIWEAARVAPHFGLGNLVAIVDFNRLQIDGRVSEVSGISEVSPKFEAFGWRVIEIDGHDVDQIRRAFKSCDAAGGVPTCIVANTIKGKGVSFMEDVAKWHGSTPSPEEFERAKNELRGRIEELESVR